MKTFIFVLLGGLLGALLPGIDTPAYWVGFACYIGAYVIGFLEGRE